MESSRAINPVQDPDASDTKRSLKNTGDIDDSGYVKDYNNARKLLKSNTESVEDLEKTLEVIQSY